MLTLSKLKSRDPREANCYRFDRELTRRLVKYGPSPGATLTYFNDKGGGGGGGGVSQEN